MLKCNQDSTTVLYSKYTHTDSRRVVSHDFKASTLLICIVAAGKTSKIDFSKQQTSAKYVDPSTHRLTIRNSRQYRQNYTTTCKFRGSVHLFDH